MTEPLVPLPISSAREVATRQVLLTLDATGTSLPAAHTIPGQYARLILDDGVARPFALASPPGSSRLEFLVKVAPDRVPGLVTWSPDDRILVGHPQGKGFPVERARGRSLWLFAVGSGIAPIRAVVEHLLPQRSAFGDVTLIYGVRDPAELAFSSRFGAWAGHDIAVWPVVSRPPPAAEWAGRTGHVQDHIPKSFTRPQDVVAFMCGLPAMERDVLAALAERGVGHEQVFRNW